MSFAFSVKLAICSAVTQLSSIKWKSVLFWVHLQRRHKETQVGLQVRQRGTRRQQEIKRKKKWEASVCLALFWVAGKWKSGQMSERSVWEWLQHAKAMSWTASYSPRVTSVCIGMDSAGCFTSQLNRASLSNWGLRVQVSRACTTTEPSLWGMWVWLK